MNIQPRKGGRDFGGFVPRSSGGSGNAHLMRKITNGQFAVFVDEAERDAYFAANADDFTSFKLGKFAYGLNTVAEVYPCDGGYFVWSVSENDYAAIVGVAGPEGEPGVPGSTPNVLTDDINQAAHGFTQNEADLGIGVYTDANGIWRRGNNQDEATVATALLADIIDVNNFTIILAGIGGRTGHGIAHGTYYLGANGLPTLIKPTTGFVQELYKVINDDLFAIDIGQAQVAGLTATDIELRGGALPDDFDNTLAYDKFSYCFWSGQTWMAITDITAGAFDPLQWRNTGSLPQAEHSQLLDDENLLQNEKLTILRGHDDVYPDYDGASPTPYPAGTVLHDSGTGKDYRAKVEIPANNGTFNENNTIQWDAVSIADNNNPSFSARRLEELTGGNRLDATAIQNLPTAGDPTPFQTVPYSGIAAPTVNQWYDIQTWQGEASPAGHSTIVGFIAETATDVLERTTMTVVGEYGVSNVSIGLSFRSENWLAGEGNVRYRVISDTSDLNGPRRLQVSMVSAQTISGVLFYELTRAVPTGGTFGSMTLYVPTGNEVVLEAIDMDNAAYLEYDEGHVHVIAGSQSVADFSATGARLSAGEYGTWAAPVTTNWPIDATFWTNLVAQQRTNIDDTTLNPSSTVTLNGIDNGGMTAENMPGFSAGHRGLRFANAGSGGILITFEDCLYQRIKFDMHFGVGSTGSGSQDYEIVDINGVQLQELTISAVDNVLGSTHEFSYTFDSTAGDNQIILRKRSSGTNQSVYLYNYTMDVIVVEPALQEDAVLQLDSPLRGFLPPRIIPSTNGDNVKGMMALNGLADNRPIWNDGSAYAYLNTTRIDFRSVDTGQFFFAEGGTFADAGWTGSNHNRLPRVENFNGFPAVIHCTQTGGTITMQAPNNTAAMWDIARANGFRVDYRMMFMTAHDGSVYTSIEPNNTSWGSNGRFEFSIQVNGGQLQLILVNSGGNIAVDIDRNIMHTVSMINRAGENTADVLLEGVKVGEVTYGGGGTTDRGSFWYISPGNTANDFAILSMTTYTLAAADLDVPMDRTAITTGLRYNVPNISQAMTLRVPKGLYDFGNTFTVVNGSTEPCIVKGLDDDHQLFGGVSEYEVFPQKEVTFTQTGFPRGNVWAVEGGKTIINHNENTSSGNSLILTVESDGTILGRHGNYLGDLPAIQTPQTGQFLIGVNGVTFDDTATVVATPKHTAGQQMTCNYAISVGDIVVDVLQAGSRVNDRFSVAIYW